MNIEYKNYRIRTYDDHNLVVEEKKVAASGKSKGKVYWEFRGYFSSLASALIKITTLVEMNCEDLEEVILALKHQREFIQANILERCIGAV